MADRYEMSTPVRRGSGQVVPLSATRVHANVVVDPSASTNRLLPSQRSSPEAPQARRIDTRLSREMSSGGPGLDKLRSTNVGSADVASRKPTLRQRIWQLMDVPSSSRWAQVIAGLVLFAICVSTAAFVLETLPEFHKRDEEVWGTIEAVCIALFTIEFVLRITTTPNLAQFCKSFLNIVDFVAIVPFYVELAGSDSESGSGAVLRVIRLVRVFRVFKISRYISWIRIFGSALALSAWPLGMLVFVMCIGVIVFSALIYFVERGDWDEQLQEYIRSDGMRSPYQSIPASFWWCIVTMTTVGYGDDVPITPWGRVIAAVTSLLGILVLAIPITVISTNFNAEYSKLKKQKELMRARMMLLKNINQSKRSGWEAISEELDELVQRNMSDFRQDLEQLFDASKEELLEELKELTKMAYEQRRQSGTFRPDRTASISGVFQPSAANTPTASPAGTPKAASGFMSTVRGSSHSDDGTSSAGQITPARPLSVPAVAALRDTGSGHRSSPLSRPASIKE